VKPPLANLFQPLIDVFAAILRVFHDDVGLSWGFSIVALTVLVRALLLPLTIKQARSTHRIAQLGPEMRTLRVEHADDPQRLQRETMALYRRHRINPLASFLPALAQLPVFLSLYYTLRTDLRETSASHFLFIPDLTSRATGAVLVALLVLYAGSQLLSFLASASPATDPAQRRIFLALPFLLAALVSQLPAGLLVYWITTNVWTIGQGAILRARLGPPRAHERPAVVPPRAGGHARRVRAAPPRPPRQKAKRTGRRH
jgi:YidC/Oxa1 family membrane protein insertase